VHNVCDSELLARWGAGSFDDVTKNVMCHFREHAAEVKATDLNDYMCKAIHAMESRRGRGELSPRVFVDFVCMEASKRPQNVFVKSSDGIEYTCGVGSTVSEAVADGIDRFYDEIEKVTTIDRVTEDCFAWLCWTPFGATPFESESDA